MSTTSLTHYHLLGLVGQGQFAQVYCAIHQTTKQIVAIKKTRHARQTISQEYAILPQLKHPNIVACYNIEKEQDNNCFILEYCESGTLRHYLNAFHQLPLKQTKPILIDILSALSYIHKKEIIHGDLKPENILLTQSSNGLTAKISDFGNACSITARNQPSREIGSPSYAAPERFTGQASYATDLYSVGIMLYEMLLGDRPFSGTPDQLALAHKHQPPHIPSTLSTPAKQLLTSALNKDPEQRFSSANEMLSAVKQLSIIHTTKPNSSNSHQLHTQLSVEQAITPTHIPYPFQNIAIATKNNHIQTANIVLDNKSYLRLSAPSQSNKTYLEFSKPSEELTVSYTLNFPLTYLASTPTPHQLIACKKATNTDQSTAITISLNPFQIRHLPSTSPVRCACSTTWGYALVCHDEILFLDRDYNALNRAKHELTIRAIAPISPTQLILSISERPLLQLLHLEKLALDIIF